MRTRFRSFSANGLLSAILLSAAIAVVWFAYSPPAKDVTSSGDQLALKVVGTVIALVSLSAAIRAASLAVEIRDGLLRIVNPFKTYLVDLSSVEEIGLDRRGPFRGMVFVRTSKQRIWVWCLQNAFESRKIHDEYERLREAVRKDSDRIIERGDTVAATPLRPWEPVLGVTMFSGLVSLIGWRVSWFLAAIVGVAIVPAIAVVYRKSFRRQARGNGQKIER